MNPAESWLSAPWAAARAALRTAGGPVPWKCSDDHAEGHPVAAAPDLRSHLTVNERVSQGPKERHDPQCASRFFICKGLSLVSASCGCRELVKVSPQPQ